MKPSLIVFIFLSLCATAQESLDSLHRELFSHRDDSVKVDILNKIAFLNLSYSLDTMEVYAKRAIALGEKLQYLKGVAEGHKNLGTAYYTQGSYSLGLEQLYESLKISERIDDKRNIGKALHNIGKTYFYQEDYDRALDFLKRSIANCQAAGDIDGEATARMSICECYKNLKMPNEGMSYCEEALRVFERLGNNQRLAHALYYTAEINLLKGEDALALERYWKASSLVKRYKFAIVGVYLYKDMGKYYTETRKYDSAFHYLYKSLAILKYYDSKDAMMLTYQALGELHARVKRYDSALFYNKLFVDITTEDFNLRRNDRLAYLENHYNLELKERELLLNREVLKSQRILLIFVGIILLIVILSAVAIFQLYLKYRLSNKKLIELNEFIREKNEEIMSQADELQKVNKAMMQINTNLEEIVEERTRKVRLQNEKLIEYAYFNSHKVRGPLARILGLVNVLHMENPHNDLTLYTDKILESAKELDDVVREITKKLDTD